MDTLFFSNWESLARTAAITLMSYILLIFLLRQFGKRTLSKMNAFDFIITIALGSTLASVMLTKDISLADGAVAFFMLIGLQYVITKLSLKSKRFSQLIKSTPTLLVYKGTILNDMMVRERIHENEITAVLRQNGVGILTEADAVVLETDGTLTVIKTLPDSHNNVLVNVRTPASFNVSC